MDVYAKWLSPTGEQRGDEIEIAVGPGVQMYSDVAYNPLMDSMLIAWQDQNVDECPLDEMWFYIGDIRGIIYGTPSFLSCQMTDKATGNPVQDALALIIGPSLPALQLTNVGGWFNVEENSQPAGTFTSITAQQLPLVGRAD